MKSRMFVPSLLLIGTLAGCQPSAAPDAAAPAPAPAAETAAAPTAPAAPAIEAEAEAATAIPDTADATWQAIDAKNVELKTMIASGSLGNVHHLAFAIRDLVAALPAKQPAMTADDQAKLASDAKFVAILAERLDASGDAGDRAAAQADYDKLVAVLNGIPRTK